ncbi:GrpB family protein [Butyrivibrio sp. XPD2002]|uniref:GrpB family protein n=1 Tax=Butyrivibrio sp. XPD2002 TaxID=1280665 RepID=UPI000415246D|nr:GrpB family protein [Butyrivibrio sp. XPD2002]
MKYVLLYVLGYVVLFSVVWLHEVGHAIWHYRFGLRNNWWKVQVKPYIFFSTPGPVDADKWEKQTPIQHVLGAYGGIMMNAIIAILYVFLLIFAPHEFRMYLVHLRYAGDNDELYFRDYLNEHPAVAKEYETLKLRLWKQYEHDRDAYTDAKTDFISKWTAEA